MKNLFYLSIVLILFSCQKDIVEEELNLDLTVQNCILIDSNPISGTVYFYGTYGTSSNPGFNCDIQPPLGQNCFVQDIFYLTPIEIWKQLEPAPNTRPSSNYFYDDSGCTLSNPQDFPTFDGYNATAANANDVYEAIVCDILSYIDTLPSLPSNQMYSIQFTSIWVDHALGNSQANLVSCSYDIYINNI